MVNLFASRRNRHHLCNYWHRDKTLRDLTEYAHNTKPAGSFYAREVNAQTNDRNVVSESFMFDQNTITLETADIQDVKINDLIEYAEDIWNVLNVQRRKVGKNEMYMKNPTFITYIQVKK